MANRDPFAAKAAEARLHLRPGPTLNFTNEAPFDCVVFGEDTRSVLKGSNRRGAERGSVVDVVALKRAWQSPRPCGSSLSLPQANWLANRRVAPAGG